MDEKHLHVGASAAAKLREGDQITTDFGVLRVDLSVRPPTRQAPNPLRAARPELLERYQEAVDSVIAARRAGLDSADC